MALDYSYTKNFDEHPTERSKYHVLYMCPESRKIKEGNREYGQPPASEQRQPCKVCMTEMREWLDAQ